jgi:hypothetical protein
MCPEASPGNDAAHPERILRWVRSSSCEVVSKGLSKMEETIMGRGILLWLLGVPIPIIILLALIWH